MDISLLFSVPLATQCHVVAAIFSVALTPVMLLRRKGDKLHKISGRIWVFAMAFTALSSFAINDIRLVGPFSPIHLLSLLTLHSLFAAIRSARAGRITEHKKNIFGAMAGLYGAGLFTLLPGRLMSQVLFPGIEMQGFIGALVAAGVSIVIWRANFRRAVSG
ncbi:DUF2306 domain-containing protein [Planktotalea sp.]|uniref:DUF2306 domain-containing protein n=1 Tax=Planktotalea sp. TaxID=2029877 RepID=UPI00329892E8